MTIIQKKVDLDNAPLMRAIRRAKELWPDSSLGVSRRSKRTEELMTVAGVGGRKGTGRVVVLPWSSPKKLQEIAAAEMLPLFAVIAASIPEGDWTYAAWANILLRGDWIEEHEHAKAGPGLPENEWVALYYPSAPKGSTIHFAGEEKPRAVETGDLLIFPADTRHRVPHYDVAAERVSISVNVRPVCG